MSRVLLIAVLALGAAAVACGGLGGEPPDRPPMIKGPDGRQYYLLERGPYKGIYDQWGRLQRIEYDSNKDGRADHIAHHDGEKTPHLLEIDEDFDGGMDRWEDYNPAGILVKVGTGRRQRGRPDLWIYPDAGGLPARKEYDEDLDGRIDRVEVFRNGLLRRAEMDTDNDGKLDRWQDWSTGRLSSEELDTNGDGKPDRRILFGERGNILKLEPISP